MTNKTARNIANWMFREGTENTTQGNWCFYHDEVERIWDVKLDAESIDLITTWLCRLYGNAILDVWGKEETGEDVFDINFGTWYYENDEDEGDEDDDEAGDECWDVVIARELAKEGY